MVKKNVTLDIFMKKEMLTKPEEKRKVKGPYDLSEGWKWVKLEEVCWINKEKRNPTKEIPN